MLVKFYKVNAKQAIKQEVEPEFTGEIVTFASYRKNYASPLTTTIVVEDPDGFLHETALENVQCIHPALDFDEPAGSGTLQALADTGAAIGEATDDAIKTGTGAVKVDVTDDKVKVKPVKVNKPAIKKKD